MTNKIILSAPERIWLQVDDDDDVFPLMPEGNDTWCWEKINDKDIEYVRADLSYSARMELMQQTQQKQIAELMAICEGLITQRDCLLKALTEGKS